MRVLVTGATNGMGKGVAHALARGDDRRHEVILLGRSQARGESTVREIAAATGNPGLSFVCGDLSRLGDVRAAVAEIRSRCDVLDGIFINAGLGYAARREDTADGMDAHFQVNYLSQFMLTLNLLELLERSARGGRVVFNVTEGGRIAWDDMQMRKRWGYEDAIHQAMAARRMFYLRMHDLTWRADGARVAFFGFQIPKTVWSNQINVIPPSMRAMATLAKWCGRFISIDECGRIIAPLFTEDREASLARSGRFVTAGRHGFIERAEDPVVRDPALQDRLWRTSLDLCRDERTRQIADDLCRRARAGEHAGTDPRSTPGSPG